MRAFVHVLAVVAFLAVALLHVRAKVRRDALAYEIDRQHVQSERLHRRLEVLESRVRSKYDPLSVHREVQRRRAGVDPQAPQA